MKTVYAFAKLDDDDLRYFKNGIVGHKEVYYALTKDSELVIVWKSNMFDDNWIAGFFGAISREFLNNPLFINEYGKPIKLDLSGVSPISD